MIQLLAMTASDVLDTPALCGLVSAGIAAAIAHVRHRKLFRGLSAQ